MSLSAKPSGSTLVLASSTPVLPCKTKSSRLRRVSPFPWPAAAAIGADIALCSGSYSSPLTQRQCSQTASFRATATAALFFAFFPPRSQSRSPYRRNSVSGPNGPKMYCAPPHLPTAVPNRIQRLRIDPPQSCQLVRIDAITLALTTLRPLH